MHVLSTQYVPSKYLVNTGCVVDLCQERIHEHIQLHYVST